RTTATAAVPGRDGRRRRAAGDGGRRGVGGRRAGGRGRRVRRRVGAVGVEPGHALGDDAAHLVELPGDENRAGGHLQVEHAVDAADRRRPRLDGAGVLVEGGEVAADLAGDGGEVTAGVDEGAADVDGLEVAVAGLLPDEGAGGGA